MFSSLESFLIWTMHPFFVGFFVLDRLKADTVSADKGDLAPEATQQLKPFSWLERLLGAMIFSAMGTGMWILLHWGVSWLSGKTFDMHHFMKGRDTWLDLVPYVVSLAALLSIVIEKSLSVNLTIRNFIAFLRALGFCLSFYILIINYLYWFKHSM